LNKDSFEKHISISHSEQTAIDWLASNCPEVSKNHLKKAMQYGAVWLTPAPSDDLSQAKTERIRRAKKQLFSGSTLHIYFDSNKLFSTITPATLVKDEGDYSVWHKPRGMFSQGTKWGDHSSIVRWVEIFGFDLNQIPNRPSFLVHRLDRATQGLILIAHSKKIAARLSGLFESRLIEKHYQAVIEGKTDKLVKGTRLETPIDDRSARTLILENHFEQVQNQTKLLLKLETGRKHQIRKHLAEAGYPIIGDRLYGGEKNTAVDLQLTSCLLRFDYQGEPKTYQL
jgi:tRNA pseudouridine32 synthase / 23S rRNA pseudouridine746 synthase